MYFCHASEIWRDFPELVAGVVYAEGITKDANVAAQIARFNAIAQSRLAAGSEGQLPEIQAWRRAFSRMGLKPTQYRCASEALLRRFRKEHSLPKIHPLIDLCNAVSLAFAIPVAAFDVAKVCEGLQVQYARGAEVYVSISGEVEAPQAREVIFADSAARAHARRWTNRQSAYSAVREETIAVLIVAEALHGAASADVARLIAEVAQQIGIAWSITPSTKILTRSSPRFAISRRDPRQ
jgi:DNA/RNA-binding domain of Phe-tRNA-synthetase-like protein